MDLSKYKELMGEFGDDAEFMDRVIKDLGLEETARVLDVGTGMGAMSILLALNGLEVMTGQPEHDPEWDDIVERHGHGDAHHHPETGHGLADHGIENMDWRENARAMGVIDRIDFQHLDAQALPFPDGSFEAVFMYDALQHIPDRRAALVEGLRVLTDEGHLCILEWNQEAIART